MKYYVTLLLLSFIHLGCEPGKEVVELNIIPEPLSIEIKKSSFNSDSLKFSFNANEAMATFYPWVQQWSSTVTLSQTDTESNVKITIDSSYTSEEYSLMIVEDNIHIKHLDDQGLKNALSSLQQLYVLNDFNLACVRISDKPLFAYRGMHLDVSRHFFSTEEIKKYLDFLAFYKYNKFHWHLSDDQGWRIEINSFPKLNSIGSYRKETLIGHYNDIPQKFDGKKYGGYYSKEEIKEIVRYATQRGIDVIPEIDLPGHSSAILAAYPEFGCEDKPYETATKWGIFYDVLCPKEATFDFLFSVFDEILELFPYQYYHIGGDECPKDAWKKSTFCQERIQSLDLKDENGLQSYFIQRLGNHLNSRGKKIIGWDEILEGGLAADATVMSWRGTDGGIEAATMGHDVIMTPTSHCYFDYYQSENSDEPLAIGGFLPIEKVYHFNPLPSELDSTDYHHILGAQGNVWTEYLPQFKDVEYAALARMATLSEVLWGKQKDDMDDFYTRLWQHVKFWNANQVNIANHLLDVNLEIQSDTGALVRLNIGTPLSGSVLFCKFPEDTGFSRCSTDEIKLKHGGTYAFYASMENLNGSIKTLDFYPHKGNAADIKLIHQPSEKYSGNGNFSVLNGVLGSANKYGGSEWLGFDGHDFNSEISWKDSVTLSSVDMRFFKGEGQWIYLPSEIDIFNILPDGTEQLIGSFNNIISSTKLAKAKFSFNEVTVNQIRIHARNFGTIPEGRQGAGHKAWLFVDEIIIN